MIDNIKLLIEYIYPNIYNKLTYKYFPKDKFELRTILFDKLSKNKNENLNDIDVSQIIDMGPINNMGLFEGLDPHNIDVSLWNVNNVENMSKLFYNCKNLNCDLSSWDVSKVKYMDFMFYHCNEFNSNISSWNVSNVLNMKNMFSYCYKFNQNLNNWNVNNVKDFSEMFKFCFDFNQDIYSWNINTNLFKDIFLYSGINIKKYI